MSKLVSVIIPTKDRERFTISTLRDISRQLYRPLEVIVVDQSLPPATGIRKSLESIGLPYLYLWVATPGASRARNTAISRAKGDILLFLDDDVRIDDECFVSHHVGALEGPLVGAVCGRVIQDGDHRKPSGLPPTAWPSLGLVLGGPSCERAAFVNNLAGGNMSVWRTVLDQVGLFDEEFGAPCLYEETDLALRIRAGGNRIAFRPDCCLTHLRAPSGGQRPGGTFHDSRF